MSGFGDQVKMAATVDRQLASRDEPVHDPRIDHGDDRVVVARQYQGELTHQRQRGEAGPADGGQQLVAIAPIIRVVARSIARASVGSSRTLPP